MNLLNCTLNLQLYTLSLLPYTLHFNPIPPSYPATAPLAYLQYSKGSDIININL